MTRCNKCAGPMVPDPTAIVSALGCVKCGRVIPLTAARTPKADRAAVSRALRAARRMRMKGSA